MPKVQADVKMEIKELKKLLTALQGTTDSIIKGFTPAVTVLADSIKDLKRIDQNTVQAIKAQNGGITLNNKGATTIHKDIIDAYRKDGKEQHLQNLIITLEQERAKLLEEENKMLAQRLKIQNKDINSRNRKTRQQKDRLQFEREQAMGLYNESRAFNSSAFGFFSQRLYQSSKNFANGNSSVNNLVSGLVGSVFGGTVGNLIGKELLGGIGKALRRSAEAADENGNPKTAIGRLTRTLTGAGTKSGKGVNAAGGAFALAAESLLLVASAAKNFNDKLIESASNLEKLTAQLGVVSGSQSSAFETFQMIKDYAFNSPYTTTETTQTAVLLKQSGVLESNLDKTIRMLGDLGMGNQERLTHISNNYAQILAAGRANSKDLREFANAGIPIYNALLEYFKNDPDTDVGNTTEAVRKLAEEGKVTSNVISRVFEKLTQPGGLFYGASSTYANTYLGQMTNLKDRLEIAKGNAADLDRNVFAKFNKGLLKFKIAFYESMFDDQEIIERQIEKTQDEQDKKYLRGIAIESDKNLKGKTVYDDEDFEALSEEERKTAISLSEYRKIIENYAINSFRKKTNKENLIYEDAFGLGLYNKEELNKYISDYAKGFRELFVKRGSQRASDFFAGLYQNSNSFAYKASNLSSAGSIYKSNSEEYKAEHLRDERLKHLATIQQYKEYDNIYRKERAEVRRNFASTGGGLKFNNFDELYNFWSSGYLSGSGKIELSKDSKDFIESDVDDLKTNIIMMTNGIRKGLEEYKQLPKDVGEAFEGLLTSVDYLKYEDDTSIDNVNKALEKVYEVIGNAEKGKKRTEEERNFLDQLRQLIDFSLVSGYHASDKPLDYKESFKLKTLRGVSGLDAKNGNTIQANIDEILRRQNKTIGTSSFRNRLKNSTLADLAISGDLLYTGRKNSYGGMEVDYMAMGENERKKFSDLADTLSRVNLNLHDYEEEMKVYTSDIRKQIDSYTQLEETLQVGEEKLSEAFNIMEDSQRASITAYGKVITNTGREYSDLRFENGVLQANISDNKDKEEWADVIGNSDLTLVLDDLTEQIRSSKSDLLLLESRLKENTLILTKINAIRDQSNTRRFDKILNNTNYFAQKGFVADKGSSFYKDFNSVISSLYSEYMSLSLPILTANSETEKANIARNFKGGKYSYSDLQNIQNLQSQSAYKDDQWILSQLELILGDKFTLIINELKKSQASYEDNVGWKTLLSGTTGLSYDTVKNNGANGTIGIYGKLQSRDILKSTMLGLGRSGATMGDMSNLGVKIADGTYNWNKTRANLFNTAVNGGFNLETLTSLKTGLESSRDAIIDLQATLLTATDTTSENNKQITDILSNLFVGNKLSGTLNGEAVKLEQFLRDDGTYGFKNAETGAIIDTLAENFKFDKETTTESLEELSNITNSTLSTVKLLETMKASVQAIENDTRDLRVKNLRTPFANGGNNSFAGTMESKSFMGYAVSAYANARSTFVNSVYEIANMNEKANAKEIKNAINSFNEKNGTKLKPEDIVDIIENAKLLKAAVDANESAEIIRILKLLGFDKDSLVTNAAKAYGEQGVIADRYSNYDDLSNIYSYFANKNYGTPLYGAPTMTTDDRIKSKIYGVSNYQSAINSIMTAEDISELSAIQELKDALSQKTLDDLQDTLLTSFKDFGINSFNDTIKTTGKYFRELADGIKEGGTAWKDFGKGFAEATKSLTANMGDLMVTAGLKEIIANHTALGVSLLLAGGMSQLVSGFIDPKTDNETDKKIETLKALKSDLKELMAQAKADAIYYEKEVSHKKALTTNQSLTKVNDAIITPSGNVINTHPDDWLIATKTPQTLGNNKSSAPVVNISIKNNSGQQLSVKETRTTSNGEINIEAIIEGVVGKGIAEGKFDNALTTRDMRSAGRSVYM